MQLNLGQKIRELRRRDGRKQEDLAKALGVSAQAVSRWEAGGGYPDIELLPALADYFSVTTDELLGYQISERQNNINVILKEFERLSSDGTHAERLVFARNAYSRYPYVAEIKVYLASCLDDEFLTTKETFLLTEAENLCKSVIDECKVIETRYNAITTLSSIYINMGNLQKAKDTLDLLAPMKYCREFVLSSGVGDGNTEYYIQDEIDKLADALGSAITNLAINEDVPNDVSTWTKKIEMLNISNQLYRMIYGENMMFYHARIAENYCLISTFEMALNRIEDAFTSLEKMCYHTLEYEKAYINDHGKFYSTVLTDKVIYPEQSVDFQELTTHSWCYYMLKRLENKRYDNIRNDIRFANIVERLKEFSK